LYRWGSPDTVARVPPARRLTIALAVVLVAGCGGSSDEERAAGDRDRHEAARAQADARATAADFARAVSRDDARAVCALLTRAAERDAAAEAGGGEVAAGGPGCPEAIEARAALLRERERRALGRAQVGAVRVTGDRARVTIVGLRDPIPLAREGGRWRVDLAPSAAAEAEPLEDGGPSVGGVAEAGPGEELEREGYAVTVDEASRRVDDGYRLVLVVRSTSDRPQMVSDRAVQLVDSAGNRLRVPIPDTPLAPAERTRIEVTVPVAAQRRPVEAHFATTLSRDDREYGGIVTLPGAR
jgi:hypothetical protein